VLQCRAGFQEPYSQHFIFYCQFLCISALLANIRLRQNENARLLLSLIIEGASEKVSQIIKQYKAMEVYSLLKGKLKMCYFIYNKHFFILIKNAFFKHC
jgi:hypothetical protein